MRRRIEIIMSKENGKTDKQSSTSCLYEFEEEYVKKYKFCPYCGKKIGGRVNA